VGLLVLCGAPHTPHHLITVKPVKSLCYVLESIRDIPSLWSGPWAVLCCLQQPSLIQCVFAVEQRRRKISSPQAGANPHNQESVRLTSFACRDRFMCVCHTNAAMLSFWQVQKKIGLCFCDGQYVKLYF